MDPRNADDGRSLSENEPMLAKAPVSREASVSEDQAGWGGGVTRRQFLSIGATTAVLASSPVSAWPLRSAPRTAAPKQVAPVVAGSGNLVLVTLYGGNDGLDTIVPFADPAYQAGRADLAWRPDQLLPLDGQFGLHPALVGLKSLWDERTLAIVRGVGYPNPNRSHFRSMDIWQTASPETAINFGWLGRWYDATGPDPLRMLHLGASVPRAFVGTKGAGAAVPLGRVDLPGGAQIATGYRALFAAPTAELGPWGARLGASGSDLVRVISSLGPILNTAGAAGATTTNLEGGAVAAGVSSAKSPFELQLDEVARLINADTPARVYSVSLGGFDTHASEKEAHSRLLANVDRGLSAFARNLAASARGANTTVLVYSEFGRRVAANFSGGTDHGTAAPVLVLGPGVKGGFYGEQPSLTDLTEGDLKFSVDFRSVYATVLGSVLGIDPAAVLGRSFAPLGFL